MPRVDNRPLTADPTLMGNIQSEVAAESRPLLMFITKYAKVLVGIIVLLIVALVGTAIFRYVENSRQEETLDAMAKIMARPADAQQIADLEKLGQDCPASMRSAVAVSLAQSAAAQNNREKAAEAYGIVAQADYDSPLGLAAAINQAGEMLSSGRYAEGVKVLQALQPRLTQETGLQVKMMLAEGAARAGDHELAAKTYEDLAATAATDLDREYSATRAMELRAMAKAGKAEAE
ncbi:MAG: tetratricopeptide repeat protein [Desulfovibrionaceae bacterium]|nr:tetratricopeptide repeat protein [Desulfovibrionaceae bacterium]